MRHRSASEALPNPLAYQRVVFASSLSAKKTALINGVRSKVVELREVAELARLRMLVRVRSARWSVTRRQVILDPIIKEQPYVGGDHTVDAATFNPDTLGDRSGRYHPWGGGSRPFGYLGPSLPSA